MTFWLRALALVLVLSPVSHAVSACAKLTGIAQNECEAGIALDRGIGQFQRKEYAGAKTTFQEVTQSYPQNQDLAARASFYSAECDRLGAQPRSSRQVLKFKSETAHGQVLSPGEKPPAATLKESQKDLLQGATEAAPPAR